MGEIHKKRGIFLYDFAGPLINNLFDNVHKRIIAKFFLPVNCFVKRFLLPRAVIVPVVKAEHRILRKCGGIYAWHLCMAFMHGIYAKASLPKEARLGRGFQPAKMWVE
jgi:hypothetical protein